MRTAKKRKQTDSQIRTQLVRKMTKALRAVDFDGDESSFRSDFWERWMDSLTKAERSYLNTFDETDDPILRTLFFRVKPSKRLIMDIFREFMMADAPWEIPEG